MTEKSNQTSGGSPADRPIEPLRITHGDQAYDVPAERVPHLHAALVAADKACTAHGREAHNAPRDRAAGVLGSEPHYLAADIAGDLAHWIACKTGTAAEAVNADELGSSRDLLDGALEHITDDGIALVQEHTLRGRLADLERIVRQDLQAGLVQPLAAQSILEAAYGPLTERFVDPEPVAEILAERFVDTWTPTQAASC